VGPSVKLTPPISDTGDAVALAEENLAVSEVSGEEVTTVMISIAT
jgi:hypothetical protein